MRDRDVAPAAVLGAIVCCGAMALIAGVIGGVALAAIGSFTAISAAGLGVVVGIAWWLDRRRHRGDRAKDLHDRSAPVEGAPR